MKKRVAAIGLGAAILAASAAGAGETLTYGYDARGRLIQVSHSGTVNNGIATSYLLDKADNRTSQNTSGAPLGPSFAVSNAAAVTEGGTLSFTVSRSGSASGNLSVDYATGGGTATASSDYTAMSGTLTFTPADTSFPVTVATTDDAVSENAETVLLNLSNASSGSTIADNQGSGTINDNEPPPPVSFVVNDKSMNEEESVKFTVTKVGTTTATVTVDYATANNTAIAGSDYQAVSGTLTFGPTDIEKKVEIFPIDDNVAESTETYFFNLSNPSAGSTIGDAQGVGTITDDDN